MNDAYISREEVLNLIDTAFESGAFDGRYAYENLIDAVQNLIHPLETDLISRQAAEQSEKRTEKRTKTHACVCISRQALQEWIKDKTFGDIVVASEHNFDCLPSVEPEKCGDCISREELKQKFQWLAKATKYGNEDSEQQNFSYSTMMMYEIADMIEDAIDNCSSVEPERNPGKWKHMVGFWECDQCHAEYTDMPTCMGKVIYEYCPSCGSKMEVDDGQS